MSIFAVNEITQTNFAFFYMYHTAHTAISKSVKLCYENSNERILWIPNILSSCLTSSRYISYVVILSKLPEISTKDVYKSIKNFQLLPSAFFAWIFQSLYDFLRFCRFSTKALSYAVFRKSIQIWNGRFHDHAWTHTLNGFKLNWIEYSHHGSFA